MHCKKFFNSLVTYTVTRNKIIKSESIGVMLNCKQGCVTETKETQSDVEWPTKLNTREIDELENKYPALVKNNILKMTNVTGRHLAGLELKDCIWYFKSFLKYSIYNITYNFNHFIFYIIFCSSTFKT